MITTALIAVGSAIIGALLGAIAMAAMSAAGAADDNAEQLAELEDLRRRLATLQHINAELSASADNYRDLFTECARANAQLRHNGGEYVA